MKIVNIKFVLILTIVIMVCHIKNLNCMQPVRAEGNQRVTGEILSVVTLDYDRKTGQGGPLSTLGDVTLNNLGIIEGDKGKSGWVNIDTWAEYEDEAGKVYELALRGVSFWVNKGGRNWFDFEVASVVRAEDGEELQFTTGIESAKAGSNQPFVLVERRYKLVPVVNSLQNIGFRSKLKTAARTSSIDKGPIVPKKTIEAAQRKLKELGYDPGPVDGIWGKKTRAAVIQFQKDKRLEVTECLDSQTLAALMSP